MKTSSRILAAAAAAMMVATPAMGAGYYDKPEEYPGRFRDRSASMTARP